MARTARTLLNLINNAVEMVPDNEGFLMDLMDTKDMRIVDVWHILLLM